MKILIDNNISFRVCKLLRHSIADCKHVSDINMDKETNDSTIWKFAETNGYCILTKDNDFEAMSRLFGCPPKVIQLLYGNKTTAELIAILDNEFDSIKKFLDDKENCMLFIL